MSHSYNTIDQFLNKITKLQLTYFIQGLIISFFFIARTSTLRGTFQGTFLKKICLFHARTGTLQSTFQCTFLKCF